MMWLIWRLHRTESLIGLTMLAVLGVALVITGLDVAETYRSMGVGPCAVGTSGDESMRPCFELSNAFLREFEGLSDLVAWLNVLPVVVAMLLAAPFLNELEHGAFRMSWTQSSTRARWAAYRIGTILAAAGLIGLVWRTVMTWWMGPFNELRGQFHSDYFNFQGTVPIAYVLFATALVLAIGSISRRAVPTLIIALVVYVPVRLGFESRVRPHFREPMTAIEDLASGEPRSATSAGQHDWIVGSGFVDELGNRLSQAEFMAICPPTFREAGPQGVGTDCVGMQGLRLYEEYQPAGRFWQFQLIETAIYLGLAAGLVVLTVWWVTRRLA